MVMSFGGEDLVREAYRTAVKSATASTLSATRCSFSTADGGGRRPRLHRGLARDGEARGVLSTPRGQVETPAFMPVGTKGTVKGLTPGDLREVGAGIVLGNTYHLYLRPGSDLIKEAGGLHAFMGWEGPILTDSGGYQVFSLAQTRRISEEGVEFASVYDGSPHVFTPELTTRVQEDLGSDVAMVLDECPPANADREYHQESLRRTGDGRGGARRRTGGEIRRSSGSCRADFTPT